MAGKTGIGYFLLQTRTIYIREIWGPRPARLSPSSAAAMLRGSQVCSALRAPLRFALGLAYGHPSAALGRASSWRGYID